MTDKPPSPFETALNMEAARKKEEQGSAEPANTRPSIQQHAEQKITRVSERRSFRAKTKPFNHRVNSDTVEGFIQIALVNGWTMNRTLSEAYALLAKAHAKGDV